MNLTQKDYFLLISPLAALFVAILTTVFNIIDRRKYYTIEKNKLVNELTKNILKGATFIEDKYRLYNLLMGKISEITAIMIKAKGLLRDINRRQEAWDKFCEALSNNKVNSILDEIFRIIRDNQTVVPNDLHKKVTRIYRDDVVNLLNRSSKIQEIPVDKVDDAEFTELNNIINEIIGENDKVKRLFHEDIDSFFAITRTVGN